MNDSLAICAVSADRVASPVLARSSAQSPTRSPAQSSAQIHFRLQTREVIEGRLKSFSTKNSEREALIRKWFAESGCKEANLSEQALDRKLPPNVICVLPGETQQVIVVGAHTDKVDGLATAWSTTGQEPCCCPRLLVQPERAAASSYADFRRIFGRGKGVGRIAVLRGPPH